MYSRTPGSSVPLGADILRPSSFLPDSPDVPLDRALGKITAQQALNLFCGEGAGWMALQ
jgi:hypothetical protein